MLQKQTQATSRASVHYVARVAQDSLFVLALSVFLCGVVGLRSHAAAGVETGTFSSGPDAKSTSDADPEISSVPFDLQLANAIRDAKSIEDIQRLVGSEGRITERDGDRASYHWLYERPDGAEDYMLFTVYVDGSFGGGI